MASNKNANELSAGLSQFALNLYSEWAQSNNQSNENVVISPLSVTNVLTLLSQAAKGKTYDQLREALRLNADKAVIPEQFSKFNEQIENSLGTAMVSMANQINVRHGYKLNIDLRDIADKKFGAWIESTNFTDSSAVSKSINQFVDKKTMGKISEAVTPDSFDSSTSVVLVNAIAFKATWDRQFYTFFTQAGDFHTSQTDTTQVDYMALTSQFNYAVIDELNATALQMNYKESALSFVVILPNSRGGLNELQSRLKNYDLSKITNQMSKKKVSVQLPRFKYEHEVTLDSVLQKMGMNEMFNRDDADLMGLLDPSMTRAPLYVSTVVHKAVIEVNEEGTEAAAVRRMSLGGADSSEPIRFTVDHPFFFFIGSSTSPVPIFCGSVYKPDAARVTPPSK